MLYWVCTGVRACLQTKPETCGTPDTGICAQAGYTCLFSRGERCMHAHTRHAVHAIRARSVHERCARARGVLYHLYTTKGMTSACVLKRVGSPLHPIQARRVSMRVPGGAVPSPGQRVVCGHLRRPGYQLCRPGARVQRAGSGTDALQKTAIHPDEGQRTHPQKHYRLSRPQLVCSGIGVHPGGRLQKSTPAWWVLPL